MRWSFHGLCGIGSSFPDPALGLADREEKRKTGAVTGWRLGSWTGGDGDQERLRGRRRGRGPAEGLTVGGAAGGAVAGAVAHLDALPPHLQETGVGDARLAGVAEALLVVATVVGDVDGRPGRPGRGLLQVGAGQAVARLVLLQHARNKLRVSL